MSAHEALGAIAAEVETYLELLLKWNRAVRLTAFSGREEALGLGVLPSLEALPLLPEVPFSALDVGTGGGFPAIPLALARRDSRWTLTEPSGRKAAFLREASRVLILPLDIRESTAERALGGGAGPFDLITVRGVNLDRKRAKSLASGLSPAGSLLVWTGEGLAGPYADLLEGAGLEVRVRSLDAPGLWLLRGAKT